jgi:hypothetical protein
MYRKHPASIPDCKHAAHGEPIAQQSDDAGTREYFHMGCFRDTTPQRIHDRRARAITADMHYSRAAMRSLCVQRESRPMMSERDTERFEIADRGRRFPANDPGRWNEVLMTSGNQRVRKMKRGHVAGADRGCYAALCEVARGSRRITAIGPYYADATFASVQRRHEAGRAGAND